MALSLGQSLQENQELIRRYLLLTACFIHYTSHFPTARTMQVLSFENICAVFLFTENMPPP